MLLKQRLIFFASAGYHRHILLVKALTNDFCDDFARIRRIRTWLDYCGIACGKRIHKRIERQHKRIIPRAHNQGNAVRRRLLKASRAELRKRRPNRLFLCIRTQMLQHAAKLTENHAAFTHIGFKRALSEVGIHCCRNLGIVFANTVFQFP